MSDEYVDTVQTVRSIQDLIKDMRTVFDTKIENLDADSEALLKKIETMKTEYQKNQEKKEQMELEQKNLKTELTTLQTDLQKQKDTKEKQHDVMKELDAKIKDEQEEIVDLKQQKEELQLYVKKLKEKIEKNKQEIEQYNKELENIREVQESEIQSLDEKVAAKQEEFQKLRHANAVLDFLLEESSGEIPEVDIIAAVMRSEENKITLDQLKERISVPPVTILRTIKQLDNKAIITFDETSKLVTL